MEGNSEFTKLNVTAQAVPALVPPEAAVKISSPELCVHTPVSPRRLDVVWTDKDVVPTVAAPVSPDIVTVDPVARS